MNDGLRINGYAVTIFLSSAALMVLEIAAARLIAPYVGVSLYTWTSIIGVILAGLSLGNWLGGVLADRGGTPRTAGITLALCALFCLASLLWLSLLAPILQAWALSLITASFLYVAALFFLPAMLLGVVTPLLTTLALALSARPGHIVGKMHALAALGSIVGTFLAGYWLIQTFGTRAVIVGTAVALFLLALPFLWRAPRTMATMLIAGLGVALTIHLRTGFANPCLRESSYYCIRVAEDSPLTRTLVLDHLIHGTNHLTEPTLLLMPYAQIMEALIQAHFTRRAAHSYFIAGGGAYTLPRAIRSWPDTMTVVVAELDPTVTEVARARLLVDTTGMAIHHADARSTLAHLDRRFDVVIGDVFHDISVPAHLLTREYAEQVRAHLEDHGLYLLNVVDAFPNPRLVKSVAKTLASVFNDVQVWLDHIPDTPTRLTYVIAAADHLPNDEQRATPLAAPGLRVDPVFAYTGTPPAALPILTDDYAPVESLLSDILLGSAGR